MILVLCILHLIIIVIIERRIIINSNIDITNTINTSPVNIDINVINTIAIAINTIIINIFFLYYHYYKNQYL